MTGINAAQVPPQLATVEQYAAWSCLLLHTLNPTLKNLESENNSQSCCSAGIFTASDATERLLIRVNFQLQPNWQTSASKLWTQIMEFSNTQPPAGFLA